MPELPEVETVVRDLRPLLCGRRIAAVVAGEKRLRFAWESEWTIGVSGKRIESIGRRGKWILIDLEGPLLVGHLGMTGQLTIAQGVSHVESHTHLRFALDNGTELRYRDVRRFGGWRWCAGSQCVPHMMAETLGPEPWEAKPEEWFRSLKRSRRPLKAILLDQSIIAGVGNIYADESLFHARIHPAKLGETVTRLQSDRLLESIIEVLERAIESRGSTIRDYIGGSGLRGEFQTRLRVYGRNNAPCLTCGSAIQCIRLAGRSTHFCRVCQRAPRVRTIVR